MGLVNPQQSNPLDTITAASVNNPVNQIATVLNGNIDSANITDSSISNAKLATGLSFLKLTNPYKFSVHWNSGAASYAVAATQPVKFDTKIFDTSNNYNITTFLFTAPISGFYQFNTTVTFNNGGGSGYIGLRWLINNVLYNADEIAASTSSGNTTASASRFMSMQANDTIGVDCYSSASGGWGIIGTLVNNNFSGFLVSPT